MLRVRPKDELWFTVTFLTLISDHFTFSILVLVNSNVSVDLKANVELRTDVLLMVINFGPKKDMSTPVNVWFVMSTSATLGRIFFQTAF